MGKKNYGLGSKDNDSKELVRSINRTSRTISKQRNSRFVTGLIWINEQSSEMCIVRGPFVADGKGKDPFEYEIKQRKMSSLECYSRICFDMSVRKELSSDYDRWLHGRLHVPYSVVKGGIKYLMTSENKLLCYGVVDGVTKLLGKKGYQMISLRARMEWIAKLIDVQKSNFLNAPDKEQEIFLLQYLDFVTRRMKFHLNSVRNSFSEHVGPSEPSFNEL